MTCAPRLLRLRLEYDTCSTNPPARPRTRWPSSQSNSTAPCLPLPFFETPPACALPHPSEVPLNVQDDQDAPPSCQSNSTSTSKNSMLCSVRLPAMPLSPLHLCDSSSIPAVTNLPSTLMLPPVSSNAFSSSRIHRHLVLNQQNIIIP